MANSVKETKLPLVVGIMQNSFLHDLVLEIRTIEMDFDAFFAHTLAH